MPQTLQQAPLGSRKVNEVDDTADDAAFGVGLRLLHNALKV